VPRLTALALDRVNEWLVRWRLGGRLPSHAGDSVVDYLRHLDRAVHPRPASLAPLEPREVTPSAFGAASPWPEAVGRNARWHAERCAARGSGDGPAPALILLHGWLIDRPQLVVYRHWARRAAARGIDVWMPRLPYHLERAEPGEVSGERCLSPDLRTSLDAVRQAVAEVRLLARWLRGAGAPAVGIWGMSLGGWVAALAATLDADWDAVAMWAPVAAPAEVLFESRLVELLRDAIVAGGAAAADFDAPEMAAMTPALRRGLVPRSRVLVVAGVYDQVVSPRSVARLARAWNVDVRWVPHGHISLMASRAPVEQTADFLAGAFA
jgi:dienelactone hydrolase